MKNALITGVTVIFDGQTCHGIEEVGRADGGLAVFVNPYNVLPE